MIITIALRVLGILCNALCGLFKTVALVYCYGQSSSFLSSQALHTRHIIL